ncbi:hypothetical protein Btru_033116 [Bulinus truncatus]|nr:hypothetical protein Btru_033116 [Bulinus truncatus]
MSHKINLLLIGYWGNGKSATGNTILGYEAFPKNNSTIAVNTLPAAKSSTDGKITVVDGLCLWGKDPESLDDDTLFDAQTAVAEFGGEGFDAIVIVLRYGETYSDEEAKLVLVAKKVFGSKILEKLGVCLVTRGDDFKYAVDEREEQCSTFEQWCKTQSGNLGKLFKECGQRCVLFDNKTKDPKQKIDLLRLVDNVTGSGARRYTIKEFRGVHGREFSPSESKMFDMKARSNFQIIRNELKGSPGEADLQRMGQVLRELSREISTELKGHQQMEKLIAEAQSLNNMIKSALEKMSIVKSHEQQGAMTGGLSCATDKQVSDMTFHSDHFNEETNSCRASDSCLGPTDYQPIADKTHKPTGKLSKDNADDFEDYKKVTDDSIRLLLLGRSGNGKSSTGNSILGQTAFKISSSTAATKSKIECKSEKLGHLNVSVVDGPSLDDAVLDANSNLDMMIESIREALQRCDYGFSGLLVVLKFGQRFMKQEKDAIVMIKSILGKDVLTKYGVCVMTHGDDYDSSMDDDERVDFDEWCRQQTGDIAGLFGECSYRCVLFNNKTRDEQVIMKQRNKLLHCIKNNERYSEEKFLEATENFEELGIQFAMPILEKCTSAFLSEVREKLHKIDEDFPKSGKDYKTQLETELKGVQAYKEKIEGLGRSSSSEYLLQLLTTLELQINSKLRLCAQKEELKELEVDKKKLYEHSTAVYQRHNDPPYNDSSMRSSNRQDTIKPGSTSAESDSKAQLAKLKEFVQTIDSLRSNANSLDRQTLLELKKSYVHKIDLCLNEASKRGEINENLDKMYAHLTYVKEQFLLEMQAGYVVPAEQYPVYAGSTGHYPVNGGSTGHNPAYAGSTGQYPVYAGSTGQYSGYAGSTGHYPVNGGSTGQNPAYAGSTGQYPVYAGSTGQYSGHARSPGQNYVQTVSTGQYQGSVVTHGQYSGQCDFGNTLTTLPIEDGFEKVLIYPEHKPEAYLSSSENKGYSQGKPRNDQSRFKNVTKSHPQKENIKILKGIERKLKWPWRKIKRFFAEIQHFN